MTSCFALAGAFASSATFAGQAASAAAARNETSTGPEYAAPVRIAALLALVSALALGLCVSYTQAALPPVGSIEAVTAADLRHSYRAGCPVGPARLRTVRVSYWGFDGRPRVGRIVVASRVAPDVLAVFGILWSERFPLRRLRPVSAYRGSDDASMAADNTSGFNCRFVGGDEALVAARPRRGDRRQPGRESLRPWLAGRAARRPRLPRPESRTEGHGARERAAGAGFRLGRVEVGRLVR